LPHLIIVNEKSSCAVRPGDIGQSVASGRKRERENLGGVQAFLAVPHYN
jgi:hypothetical protein